MTTRRQGMLSDSDRLAEPGQLSSDSLAGLAPKRPIWEVVVEIGAQIPDEVWATVPDDASKNYRRYLYGALEKSE
jgi:hypothetical protein